MQKIKDYIMTLFDGFCMALADSVPGVSGGTVAFLLGFYDQFIGSIDALFRGSWEEKKGALKFLIKLGIGWVVGFLLSATILASLFTTKIYAMSSLFIGFIIFAIPLVIKEEREVIVKKYGHLVFTLLGIILVALVTYLTTIGGLNINLNTLNIGSIIYIFLAAMVAISAMVLPGISGSTLLLVFGLYIPIMTRIKSLLSFDFSVLPILVIFGLGVVTGLLVFTRLIKNCLAHFRSQSIYFILGMMIGSLYSICMGPTTLENPLPILSIDNFDILFFIIGGAIIALLEGAKRFSQKKLK